MLRRKNRKRSNSRTPKQNRNTVGRKIACEKLQDRKLMAADFGGFGDFYGPRMPANDNIAAQISFVAPTQQANAMEDSPLEITHRQGRVPTISFHDGTLSITGRDDNEVVSVDFNQRTGNLDIHSQTYNRFGQRVGQIRARIDWNLVTTVRTNLKGGNDTLDASDAWRRVVAYGGSGNDTLIGGARNDLLDGESGQDTLKGLSGNDTLRGGDHDDVIYGGFDNDTINGGDGNDTIHGEHGADAIYGEAGNDRIFGGSHNDFLSGGSGHDFMSGGSNNDIMHGDSGNDTMHGNSGNDTVVGWKGNDWIYGGSGNDTLAGKRGTDHIYGGSGEDTLDGGDDGKRDQLFGQAGRDTFVRHTHWFSADDPDDFVDYRQNGYDRIIKR